MIESLIKNADGIRAVLSREEYSEKFSMLLSKSDLDVLDEICQILLPFKQATIELSGKILRSFNFYK